MRVLATPDVAVGAVRAGATVAIGGSLTAGHPMALVRALIRRRPTGLLLVGGMTAGLELDLLVAAGVARGVVAPFVGAEDLAALPPAIRWAAEEGRLEVTDTDEGIHLAALRARAQRLPYVTWSGGMGTSVAQSAGVETAVDESTGAHYLKVRPLPIDVALLWSEAADEDGSLLSWGPDLGDQALRAAADHRIVQVERVVGAEVLALTPDRVAPWSADVVVAAPLGTHPFGGSLMREDAAWLTGYVETVRRARDQAAPDVLEAFIAAWAREPAGEDAYLEKVGIARLRELMA